MSRHILVTGGTVFVSKYIAEYFAQIGDQVYVLNRNNHPQPMGCRLIEADRHQLGDSLKDFKFDVVIDVNAYKPKDIAALLEGLGEFKEYIFISSSAVYPENLPQPFKEDQPVGENQLWKTYGTDKIACETYLFERVPHAYSLRPPYIYGPYNNAYREAFVFDCAMANRPFYLPGQGQMGLHFIHIKDLARCVARIIDQRPSQHIYNVGNPSLISSKDWVKACYKVAGNTHPEFINVGSEHVQHQYFPFAAYQYLLDVSLQERDLINTYQELDAGLEESFNWYQNNQAQVNKRPYFAYIEANLA